jgi:hypothetical protein
MRNQHVTAYRLKVGTKGERGVPPKGGSAPHFRIRPQSCVPRSRGSEGDTSPGTGRNWSTSRGPRPPKRTLEP